MDERGILFEECICVIKVKKLLVVLFENVCGIFIIKNLDGLLLLDFIVLILDELDFGYNVEYKLLKVSDYGVF